MTRIKKLFVACLVVVAFISAYGEFRETLDWVLGVLA